MTTTATSKGYEVIERGGGEDRTGWLPERASWVIWEIRQYPNGDTFRYEREDSRWASSYQAGEWELASERAARIAKHELTEARRRIALYVEALDNPEEQPFPPIKGAENPGRGTATWLKYLRREADKAERVLSCMYPDSTHERRCENVDFTTGQPWGPGGWKSQGACAYCSRAAEKAMDGAGA